VNKNWTAPALAKHKVANGESPLVMVTAYDAPSARMADAADVDLILVGDTLAMVVLGYDDTLQVTINDMAYHVAAVARARPTPFIVGDLPWLSYHLSVEESVRNAATLIRAGAQAVKLEGGRKRLPMIEAIVNAEIPVMGHIGLTPQSTHAMGGFRVQARELDAARELVEDARALVDAGVFAIVLEGIPDVVAERITAEVPLPTIGIGAGRACDGQVLVFHDLLGFEERLRPKFVRRYATMGQDGTAAIRRYASDVRRGDFPADAETYHASEEVARALREH
jgi:3-methyl-2-oxobutanoate hydroxymethyltransferase